MAFRYVLTMFVGFQFVSWTAQAQPQEPRRLPGMQSTGEILLPTQWSLRPAGKQLKLGDFPVNIALHPSGAWAAILHAGYGEHEVLVIDLKAQQTVSRTVVPQTFYGICFDSNGKRLFVSGGEYEVVHQFHFSQGYLSNRAEIRIADESQKFVPTGLCCDEAGKRLFVANAWGHTVAIIPLDLPTDLEHISMPPDSYPYTCLLSHDQQNLFVSLWGGSAVAVLDMKTQQIATTWITEAHPTEMSLTTDGSLLYVACANSNFVSVIDTTTGQTLEIISTALYPNAPNGSTPSSLSLTDDEKVLFVANADNNNVAVIDVSLRGQSRSLGYIPAGWYPTSVRYNSTDKRIYIANGKGQSSKANRLGPNPIKDPPRTVREYISGLMRGTLSVVESPSPAKMADYTKTSFTCSPLREDQGPSAQSHDPNNPIPAKLGVSSPIKHCIYIIKENRTYDQIFGDIPAGNGDPDLCIFPERVTPNHHALAKQFVLLDNFYVESEVSADGHEWSMAAYATDFVEKSWPLSYRGGKGKLSYPSEGKLKIAFPAGGYIWDRCQEANVSYRSYGEFIDNGPKPEDPGTASVPSLEGHFDPLYRSYDLDYPDAKRADRFIQELAQFEVDGVLPQFMVIRIPNDHTFGTRAGKPTPTAMVADNDLALGRVIEAISHSKFWPETAVFVVEDDAQNGSDHVDAHRTVALVISPYTKQSYVDSSMYSTASMLRTMELILGLQPMSQFDAAARPMYNSFQPEPNLTTYEHREANVDLNETNSVAAWGAKISEELDFAQEDAADDLLLNEIVWRSVRGADSTMPPPVRASFVFVLAEEEE